MKSFVYIKANNSTKNRQKKQQLLGFFL